MIPGEAAEKLAKMLPRLGSEHDGEVIATVRAMGRTLAAVGADWRALADAITTPRPATTVDWAAAWAAASAAVQDPDAPDARSRKTGYPIWGTSRIEPWNVVAGHCLQVDQATPKEHGGKSLAATEKARLRAFQRGYGSVTNAEAEWIESIVRRCHAARNRARGMAS